MSTLIKGGRIVNEGKTFTGDIVIDGETITCLTHSPYPEKEGDVVIDATGCFVLPGIIDTHVHFREPGLTAKACIETESRAAAAGGVTSYFDMPNTVPQTTTLDALDDKFRRAAKESHVNYSFFFGATNDNVSLFPQLDPTRIPGIKLFMGSSTGNMLVDQEEALGRIFAATRLPIMAHCEDTGIINRNMAEAKKNDSDDPAIGLHPFIHSEEACLLSTQKAIALAKKHHAILHVAHVSTAEELELFPTLNAKGSQKASSLGKRLERISAEATVGHLYFSLLDYPRLGAKIKVNPSIKSPVDQFMLREALKDGRITTIGTDHAPHLLSEKQGGCAKAASGMPMIQFSLVTMLELVDKGVLSIERLVELMCHNPARLFGIEKRGFLRQGYKADIAIIRPDTPWTVTPDIIESRCGWSPMEGHEYRWRVEQTLCNGHLIYNNGKVSSDIVGQEIRFNHADDTHI